MEQIGKLENAVGNEETYGRGLDILKVFVIPDWLQKGTPLIGTMQFIFRVKIGN